MKQNLFIGLFIVFLLLLFGCMYSNNINENFYSPEVSSSYDVGEGASQYYGWGFKMNEEKKKRRHHKRHKDDVKIKVIERKCPKCENIYLDKNVCNVIIDDKSACKYCDITQNKDIDKYVLKSSVPPCPDMSQYALKSQLPPQYDMSKYILKSKIPEVCSNWRQKVIIEKPLPDNSSSGEYIKKEHCRRFKRSWMTDLDDWLKNFLNKKEDDIRYKWERAKHDWKNKLKMNDSSFPKGYGYSPYAGFGTNNPGYGLSGNKLN